MDDVKVDFARKTAIVKMKGSAKLTRSQVARAFAGSPFKVADFTRPD